MRALRRVLDLLERRVLRAVWWEFWNLIDIILDGSELD